MLGNPGLVMRMAVASVVFAAVGFAGMMALTSAAGSNSESTVRITLPNGEVISDGPGLLDLGTQLNGDANYSNGGMTIPGLDPSGGLLAPGSQSPAAAGTTRGPGGMYRYSYEPAGPLSGGGTVKIEKLGE